MDATSGAAGAWWILALVILYLAVIPVVVLLAHRLLRLVREIKRYADDVLNHGLAISRNLDPVPALAETRDLVKSVGRGLDRYARAVDRLL